MRDFDFKSIKIPPRMTPEEAKMLYDYVRASYFLDGCYLETGTAYGGSVAVAGMTFPRNICAIDPMDWDPRGTSDYVLKNITIPDSCKSLADCFAYNTHCPECHNRIFLFQNTSENVLKTWKDKISCLFLDSGFHEYELVSKELKFIDYVEDGGFILFHNDDLEGVKKAIREAICKYNLILMNHVGILAVFQKSSSHHRCYSCFSLSMRRLWEECNKLPVHQVNTLYELPTKLMYGILNCEKDPCGSPILHSVIKSYHADLNYPIIFGEDGTLFDGGHRVFKCIASGKPIRYVIWNKKKDFIPMMIDYLTYKI